MRDVVYWPAADRLVYFDEPATPEFWESYWQAEGEPPQISQRDYVVTATRKYLAPGVRVLEGGCGRGNRVRALADAGFSAIGVDYAANSVREAKGYYPGLDIRTGDVRSLDFPSGSFSGYWSIGVIEHFWTGYDSILAEAARVLKPNGVLFLTAPWLSPFRKRKIRAGEYSCADFADEPDFFFQFALSRQEVTAQLQQHGFTLLRWYGMASDISMQQDMTVYKRSIDWVFASRGSIFKRVLRRVLSTGLNPYCGHSFLAIARCGNDATESSREVRG